MKGWIIIVMALLLIGIGALTVLKVATGSWGYEIGHTESGEVKFATPLTYLLVGGGVLLITLGLVALVKAGGRK